MKDILIDVVKHTHGIGLFEAVKITGDASETRIGGIDPEHSVLMFGRLHETHPAFEGTTGMANLNYLSWLLHWDYMKEAIISVIHQDRNGKSTPVELEFDNGSSEPWFYRFMSSQLVEEQMRTVSMTDVQWNITFQPTDKNLKTFWDAAGGTAAFEPNFTVSMKDGNVMIGFGTGSNAHRGSICFASGVEGTLTKTWSWPITKVLSILKLSTVGTTTVSISSVMGALKISHDSGMGVYDYILPALSA